MAMGKCRECGEAISDSAKSCPKCGCAKPIKKISIAAKIIIGIIVLAAIGHFAGGGVSGTSKSTTSPAVPANASAPPIAHWEYSQSVDKMRGTVTKFAEITSTNLLDFKFPYNGGSSASITIQRDVSANTWRAVLRIDKGQFASEGCLQYKFDREPIIDACKSYDTVGNWHIPDSGAPGVVFIFYNDGSKTEDKVALSGIKRIEKAKHLTIEAPFFQEGARQMEFDVSGLDMTKLQ